jgi:hypothetical protein
VGIWRAALASCGDPGNSRCDLEQRELKNNLERPKAMSDAEPTLAELFLKAHQESHASIVLRLVAVLEYDLERCLKRRFRKLNGKMQKRLFGTYGPASTFAAKIDLAYALDITTDETHAELNKFRQIRNVFAHNKGRVSLDMEPIKTMFYTLKRPPGMTGSYSDQFVKCVIAVDDHLEAYLVRMGETEDLRALKKPAETIERSAEPRQA